MEKLLIYIQGMCVVISKWLNWFMGDYDNLLYVLITFVVLDYLTGVMCAIVDKNFSNKIGFQGVFEKIWIFGVVGISHILDAYVIATSPALRTTVIFFYIAAEGISLLRNAVQFDLPIPQPLRSVLEQLHSRSTGEKKEDEKKEDEKKEDKKKEGEG